MPKRAAEDNDTEGEAPVKKRQSGAHSEQQGIEASVTDHDDESEFEDPEGYVSDEDAFDFFSGAPAGDDDSSLARDIGKTDASLEKTINGTARWTWIGLLRVDDIRILYLERAPGPIRCRFSRTSLHDPSPYWALSYTWGETKSDDSHLTHSILCDGVVFPVTANLHGALSRLRDLASGGTHLPPMPAIWIDAICIDQRNSAERSRQVMIMDQIYRKATQLLIWLGEIHDEPTPILNSDMQILAADVQSLSSRYPFETSFINSQLRRRHYWSRRWVIQEILCCEGPQTVFVGPYFFPVTNAAHVLRDQLQSLVIDHTKVANDGGAIPVHLLSQRDRCTLLQNLLRYREAQCSDERDIIYALKSISTDAKTLEVDYRKTCIQICIDLTTQWITAGYLGSVLAIASRTHWMDHGDMDAQIPTKGLPSWVPDWRRSASCIFPEQFCDVRLSHTDEDVDIPQDTSNPKFCTTSDGRRCLTVQAWLLEPCDHFLSKRKEPVVSPHNTDCNYCFVSSSCDVQWLTSQTKAPFTYLLVEDAATTPTSQASGNLAVFTVSKRALEFELEETISYNCPFLEVRVGESQDHKDEMWYSHRLEKSTSAPLRQSVTLI